MRNLGLINNIELHTHAGNAIDNHVTLIFDLFTSGSTYAERLPCTIFLSSLVLIARVVLLLERGHTRTVRHTKSQTHATDDLTYPYRRSTTILYQRRETAEWLSCVCVEGTLTLMTTASPDDGLGTNTTAQTADYGLASQYIGSLNSTGPVSS